MRTPRLPLALTLALAACGGDTTTRGPATDTGLGDTTDAAAVGDADTDGSTQDAGSDTPAADVPDAEVSDAEDAQGDDASDADDADVDSPETVVLRLLPPANVVLPGETFAVGCRAEEMDGTAVGGVPTRVFSSDDAVEAVDGGWMATRSGTVRFECEDRRGLLPDAEPLELTIAPAPAVRVVTRLETESVVAGEPLTAWCEAFDPYDTSLGPVDAALTARSLDGTTRAVSHTAGAPLRLTLAEPHEVACSVAGQTLTQEDANVVVTPGPAVGVATSDPGAVQVAGTPLIFACTGVDAYGNPTGPAPDAELDVTVSAPSDDNYWHEVEGLEATLFDVESSPFTVRCEAPSLESTNAATVELVPGEACRVGAQARFNGGGASRTLDRYTFVVPPGTFLYPAAVLTDCYVNTIIEGVEHPDLDARIEPDLPRTAGGWTLVEPGEYEMWGLYVGDLEGIRPQPRPTRIFVDSGGPSLSCLTPGDGEWTDLVPGETTDIAISVTDERAVTSVTVNGVEASEASPGVWSAPWEVHPGVNLVHVIAEDDLTLSSAVACAFVAGYGDQPTDVALEGTMRLGLGAEFLDDDDDDGPDSLADLLASALTSDALIGGLETSLAEEPTLWEGTIGSPPFAIEGRAEYRGGFRVDGPNDVDMRAEGEGLTIDFTVREVGFDVRVVTNLFGTVDGRLTAPSLSATIPLSVSVEDGSIAAAVGARDPVSVATLRGEFDNAAFWLAFQVAEPDLRAELTAAVDDALDVAFEGLTSGDALGGDALDLGSSFDVDAIDDRTPFTVTLTAQPGRMEPRDGALWIDLDSHVAVTHADPPLHVAPGVPAVGDGMTVLAGDGFAVRLNLNLINQALVGLWEAGYFDASLYDFGDIFEFAEGASIGRFVIQPELPPLVYARDGRIVLGLGAVYSDVLDVFYGDGIIDARLGAEISALPTMDADGNLAFTDVRVERGIASLQPANFTNSDYERIVDSVLGIGLTDVAREVFAAALPALPTLRVEGSADTAVLGIPEGTALVIGDLEADVIDDWLFIDGAMRVE